MLRTSMLTLYDVSSFGIYKIKGVGDVFAGRVEHLIVKPGVCPGDNVDFNIKGLDKINMARSRDVRGVQEGPNFGPDQERGLLNRK